MDPLFDHFLSKNWQKYSEISLADFVNKFHKSANKSIQYLPTQQKQFIQRVIASNLLLSYQSFEGFIKSLERVGSRLSPRIKRKDSTVNYIDLIDQNYSPMKQDFEQFFPDLIKYFKNHDLGDKNNHFLK